MKRDVPARPGTQPLQSSDVDIAQLKQLVEIQTQIVNQAKQIKLAKQRTGLRHRLAAGPRRLLGFISQLW